MRTWACRRSPDDSSATKLGAEVSALLRHGDALLLLASHGSDAGGRGLSAATMQMLFGFYCTVGSAIGALVDGYSFAAAFAAMAASQVVAALVLPPVRLRQAVDAAPGRL